MNQDRKTRNLALLNINGMRTVYFGDRNQVHVAIANNEPLVENENQLMIENYEANVEENLVGEISNMSVEENAGDGDCNVPAVMNSLGMLIYFILLSFHNHGY